MNKEDAQKVLDNINNKLVKVCVSDDISVIEAQQTSDMGYLTAYCGDTTGIYIGGTHFASGYGFQTEAERDAMSTNLSEIDDKFLQIASEMALMKGNIGLAVKNAVDASTKRYAETIGKEISEQQTEAIKQIVQEKYEELIEPVTNTVQENADNILAIQSDTESNSNAIVEIEGSLEDIYDNINVLKENCYEHYISKEPEYKLNAKITLNKNVIYDSEHPENTVNTIYYTENTNGTLVINCTLEITPNDGKLFDMPSILLFDGQEYQMVPTVTNVFSFNKTFEELEFNAWSIEGKIIQDISFPYMGNESDTVYYPNVVPPTVDENFVPIQSGKINVEVPDVNIAYGDNVYVAVSKLLPTSTDISGYKCYHLEYKDGVATNTIMNCDGKQYFHVGINADVYHKLNMELEIDGIRQNFNDVMTLAKTAHTTVAGVNYTIFIYKLPIPFPTHSNVTISIYKDAQSQVKEHETVIGGEQHIITDWSTEVNTNVSVNIGGPTYNHSTSTSTAIGNATSAFVF